MSVYSVRTETIQQRAPLGDSQPRGQAKREMAKPTFLVCCIFFLYSLAFAELFAAATSCKDLVPHYGHILNMNNEYVS